MRIIRLYTLTFKYNSLGAEMVLEQMVKNCIVLIG